MKSEIKKKLKAAQAPPVKAQETTATMPKMTENNFIIGTLAAYVIIGLLGVFHHEMWRDELQTWLVGASSKGFGEFLNNMKGESNPLLWYSINFILSRFTDSPVIAQVFHFLISVGSVYLILKYAPFNRLQKVLLSFSYFVIFEYSLIARGYALTIFFIFLFCALYQIKSKNRYLILGGILFLLANTTGVHGVIVALSLLGFMIADYYYSSDATIRKKYKPLQPILGALIVLIGIYIAFKCISPPLDSDRSNKWFTSFDSQRLAMALRTFWMSFFPLPSISSNNFWNTNMFFQKDTSSAVFGFFFLIALAIFIFCVLLYSKKLSVAILYLMATCGIILLTYSNNTIYALFAARYYGFIFISFIAAAWLAPGVSKSKKSIPGLSSLSSKLNVEKYFPYLLTGLLVVNSIGSLIAYVKDSAQNFSTIKLAGDYIIEHNLAKLPETGFIDYAVAPISAYTKQPIYFPDRDTTGRYTTWGVSKFSFDPNVIFTRVMKFISKQKDSVLFISTGDYYGIGAGKVINNIQFTLLSSFDGGVVPDERYNVYLASKYDPNRQVLDTASLRNPAVINSLMSSAYTSIQNGKLDDAEKILNSIKDKSKGGVITHLHNYYGMLYNKKNMSSEAEAEYKTEISLNLAKEEAFLNLGIVYFNDKKYEKAISAWASTVAINPKNADAYNNLGASYLNFKQDSKKAMPYFEKAVELSPDFTQGYINILVCAQNSNDEQATIKYTRILLDKGTSINDIKAKGINYSDALLKKINAR